MKGGFVTAFSMLRVTALVLLVLLGSLPCPTGPISPSSPTVRVTALFLLVLLGHCPGLTGPTGPTRPTVRVTALVLLVLLGSLPVPTSPTGVIALIVLSILFVSLPWSY